MRGPARPRGPSSPPRAPAGSFAGPEDTAEAARLFRLLLLALIPLLSSLSPRPRREAQKRSGGAEGFAGFPLLFLFFCPAPTPPLFCPHPAPATPPRQALWRMRPGFGRAPPLRGLLSRDSTGGAREAGLGRAPIGGPGAGPLRHKAHRPAHVTPRFMTRSVEPEATPRMGETTCAAGEGKTDHPIGRARKGRSRGARRF